MRIAAILLILLTNIFASSLGGLSLVVLKDGLPLKSQSFTLLDTRDKSTMQGATDSDGYFFVKLKEGSYQIILLAKHEGKAQAFVRKNVTIQANRDSQIIISLKKDNSIAFIDAEAPKSALVVATQTKKVVQKGTLVLSLLSAETKKKVSGATLFVKGSNIEELSDAKGVISLELPAGKHTLSIIHQDYSAQTIVVDILPKEFLSKVVSLSPASMELDEFVVLAPHIEGSVAASLSQERNNDAVGNVLGSEQFTKSGSSNLAGALKRVSGVTIVGGKYVYVRGLGDRYSTILLNGLNIPSPEPTKRVVPLNIFPTSVVESITIQKSYTANLPASFGGGDVLIKTKDIPKDNDGYVKFSLQLLANNSTGHKVTMNSDNTKSLPSGVIKAGHGFSDLAAQTKNVLNYRTFNHQTTTLQPGKKIQLSVGKSFDITKNIKIGASANISYKNRSNSNNILTNKYVLQNGATSVSHAANIQSEQNRYNTLLSGMLNLGIDYYDHNKIKYTYFKTSNEIDETLLSRIDYGPGDDIYYKTYYKHYTKAISMHQISGTNDIRFSNTTDGYFDNIIIDWAGEIAKATRKEPGTMEYKYRSNSTTPLFWDKNSNYYYYFNLKDAVNNYRVDFTLPYKFNSNKNYTKVGLFMYDKKRNYDSRTFSIYAQGNLPQNPRGNMDTIYKKYANQFDFRPSYDPRDSYGATQTVSAFYLKQLFSVTHDFDLIASTRMENSKQQLIDSSQTYAPLITSDFFPSLGLTYRFDDDNMQLRFAYAKTISRPDFREFSSGVYKNPITENDVFGNPNLQATYINHLDLKYEWYLSNDEVFSLAVFAKQFTNPIEKVMKPNNTQGGVFKVTYQNAASADSQGVEMNLRKRFGFINKDFENLLFSTNLTYIQSTIVLNQDPNNDYTSQLTTQQRPMQGQSPYVLNFILGYDSVDNGNSALLLFNQIGERIVSLGTNGNKDIYQQPFAKLDFVWIYDISKKMDGDTFGYALRFKANNLLNSTTEFTQGGLVTSQTRPGRYYSMRLSINY